MKTQSIPHPLKITSSNLEAGIRNGSKNGKRKQDEPNGKQEQKHFICSRVKTDFQRKFFGITGDLSSDLRLAVSGPAFDSEVVRSSVSPTIVKKKMTCSN